MARYERGLRRAAFGVGLPAVRLAVPVPRDAEPPDLDWHRSKLLRAIDPPLHLEPAVIERLARMRAWSSVLYDDRGHERPASEQRRMIASAAGQVPGDDGLEAEATPAELFDDDPFA